MLEASERAAAAAKATAERDMVPTETGTGGPVEGSASQQEEKLDRGTPGEVVRTHGNKYCTCHAVE